LKEEEERMNRRFVLAMAGVVGLTIGPWAGAADDQAKLAKEAKISKEKAQEIALKKAPGTVESSELEREKGTLVYSFDIKTGKGVTEVLVSAIDGHVVSVSHETPAKEAAEKKKEAQEKKQGHKKTTHQ
jgi:hypothetical protein